MKNPPFYSSKIIKTILFISQLQIYLFAMEQQNKEISDPYIAKWQTINLQEKDSLNNNIGALSYRFPQESELTLIASSFICASAFMCYFLSSKTKRL